MADSFSVVRSSSSLLEDGNFKARNPIAPHIFTNVFPQEEVYSNPYVSGFYSQLLIVIPNNNSICIKCTDSQPASSSIVHTTRPLFSLHHTCMALLVLLDVVIVQVGLNHVLTMYQIIVYLLLFLCICNSSQTSIFYHMIWPNIYKLYNSGFIYNM